MMNAEKIVEFLDLHKYHTATERGVSAAMDDSYSSKATLRDLFRKHPNWDEDEDAIVFDGEFFRVEDKDKRQAAVAALFEGHRYDDVTVTNGCELLASCEGKTCTQEDATMLATFGIKAAAGQKYSRIFRAYCVEHGVAEFENFERYYAIIADSWSPLTIKKKCVLSINFMDFLLMSNGNSWSSCHTIFKYERVVGSSYSGCYSGGTTSYAADDVTAVFYTLPQNAPKPYCLCPKETRMLVHYQAGEAVFSRIYPQTHDGETGIYQSYRAICQQLLADAAGKPNLWRNVNFTCYSDGLQYADYNEFDSLVKRMALPDTYVADMHIGNLPICLGCGRRHENEECIMCHGCVPVHECSECGNEFMLGDGGFYDSTFEEYVCNDCATSCDGCGAVYAVSHIRPVDGGDEFLCTDCGESRGLHTCWYCRSFVDGSLRVRSSFGSSQPVCIRHYRNADEDRRV